MNKLEHIAYWLESAEYDIQASESMFQSGYYVWALFIGHLVLEKTMKAIYVQNSENIVPQKIHNLIKLANISNIQLNTSQIDIFEDINTFHIEGRYSEFKNELYKICTKEFSLNHLNNIKEQFLWLKSQIK
jgi:HEPN domain-containing protein